MPEAVTIFRQALDEQGLDAEVSYESDEYDHKFYVRKDINGEKLTFATSITNRSLELEGTKQIAIAAREIAEEAKDYIEDTFEWNGRRVTVTAYSEPEATCCCCGSTVELERGAKFFTEAAELSSPHPVPVESETLLAEMDEHSRVLLKTYLMGKLRHECSPQCPNGTESFVRTEPL